MKKLLLILMVWGCDYAPTKHTHDTEHEHDDESEGICVGVGNYFNADAWCYNKDAYHEHHDVIVNEYECHGIIGHTYGSEWYETLTCEEWCEQYKVSLSNETVFECTIY